MSRAGVLQDSYGRVMRDLRISITDRCNFRCLYCLPETEEAANFYQRKFQPAGPAPTTAPVPLPQPRWKPKHELLTYEEIETLARVAVGLGIDKIRVTGGEPLLRNGVEELVARLSRIEGIADLALTTNGFLFVAKGRALKRAGLRRASFSLDSLDAANFKRMTGRDGLDSVLAGIQLAQELELHPVKVNAVVIRGINDHELEGLADFGRQRNLIMRFIEFMPLDSGRTWLKELVVPGREIITRLQQRFDLQPIHSNNASETARRWRIGGSQAEIGVIAPVTEPFCGHCNRLRLTADGFVRTCLFSLHEHDLKPWLRPGTGSPTGTLAERLQAIVGQKEARHHIGEPDFVQPARTMSCIGG